MQSKILLNYYYFALIVVAIEGLQSDGDRDRSRSVSTSSGTFSGIVKNTRWGRVLQLNGIPYANPPARFMPSKLAHRASAYPTPLDSQPSPGCPLPRFNVPLDSEDCLKLNVWLPFGLESTDLPILIFVPGDDALFDMRQYEGSALAAEGRIVVVTVNYRTGPLGFLSMGNSTLPGNAGLSDIITAIKFMKLNAKAFHGDEDSITLAGRLNGAMGISSLISSPMFLSNVKERRGKPLLNRVILHGGIATAEFGFNSEPGKLFHTFLEKTVNCSGKRNGDETLRCLQEMDVTTIQEIAAQFSPSAWKPSFSEHPMKSVELGKFPKEISFLVGDNLNMGSYCYDNIKRSNPSIFKKLELDSLNKEEFYSLVQSDLVEFFGKEVRSSPLLHSLVAHEFIFREPLPSQRSKTVGHASSSWADVYFSFCSSLYFRYPVELFARYVSRNGATTYRYELAYRPSYSTYPSYLEGALGEEVHLLFPPTSQDEMSPKDVARSEELRNLWVSFVKHGMPKGVEEFNELSKVLVGITGDGVKNSTTESLDEDVEFWRDVFSPLQNAFKTDCCCSKEVKLKYTSPPPGRSSTSSSRSPWTIGALILGTSFLISLFIFVLASRFPTVGHTSYAFMGRRGSWSAEEL